MSNLKRLERLSREGDREAFSEFVRECDRRGERRRYIEVVASAPVRVSIRNASAGNTNPYSEVPLYLDNTRNRHRDAFGWGARCRKIVAPFEVQLKWKAPVLLAILADLTEVWFEQATQAMPVALQSGYRVLFKEFMEHARLYHHHLWIDQEHFAISLDCAKQICCHDPNDWPTATRWPEARSHLIYCLGGLGWADGGNHVKNIAKECQPNKEKRIAWVSRVMLNHMLP